MPKINWSAPSPLDATMLPAVANRANRLADSYAKVGQATTAVQLQSLAQVLRDSSPQAAEAIAARLNLWQKAFIEQLVELSRQFDPPPLDLSALPEELRSHYVSDDGTYALYIYPRADMDLWQAGPLHEFMSDIEARMSGVHGSFTVTGIASNIDHTTGAIARSFVLAALLALGLIVLLVWIDLRNVGQTLAAISVLALGLPMLLTIMALTGMNWNFANFFGLPILIGAGHEYGVFMVHRYRESVHSPQRIWRWWDPADRALLLCALITSSSFGFFYLLGHHTGLRSLGWVMAVGTACIYLAAVLVLRPVLRWRLRRMG